MRYDWQLQCIRMYSMVRLRSDTATEFQPPELGEDQGDVGQMRVSRIVRIVAVVSCGAVAGVMLSLAAGVAASQQGNWTLENVLKQLDTQAAGLPQPDRGLGADQSDGRRKRQVHRIRSNFCAA